METWEDGLPRSDSTLSGVITSAESGAFTWSVARGPPAPPYSWWPIWCHLGAVHHLAGRTQGWPPLRRARVVAGCRWRWPEHRGARSSCFAGGALAPSALFDTISYGPSCAPSSNDQCCDRNAFPARHDAVGLGGASCAPADCRGNQRPLGGSCFVSSHERLPNPAAPTGCYAGASAPPPGTVLVVGEAVTWAAVYDGANAWQGPPILYVYPLWRRPESRVGARRLVALLRLSR